MTTLVGTQVPSPYVALRDYLRLQADLTELIGVDNIVVGPLTHAHKNKLPTQLIQIETAGLFTNDVEVPIWVVRAQINTYGKTDYEAHQLQNLVVGILQGQNNLIVEADESSEGVKVRLTHLDHTSGPLTWALDEIGPTPMEISFWQIGAIRAVV